MKTTALRSADPAVLAPALLGSIVALLGLWTSAAAAATDGPARGATSSTDHLDVLVSTVTADQAPLLRLSGQRSSGPVRILAIEPEVDLGTKVVTLRTTLHIGLEDAPSTYNRTFELTPLPPGSYAVDLVGRDSADLAWQLWDSETLVVEPTELQRENIACSRAQSTAATLLFPYFEASLDSSEGLVSLVSINSTSELPLIAHVVLWSDGAIPVLDFDLYFEPHGTQTFNLKDVLVAGRLPDFPVSTHSDNGCAAEAPRPPLDPDTLTTLAARLTGRPDPEDGLCYSGPRPDDQIATGYLTVDVVNGCSDTLRTPFDDGYFRSGGQGLASNQNVLWGDLFLVDPDGNSAQGLRAVPIPALDGLTGPTFYHAGGNDRLPLPADYRHRFFLGGGFTGRTEVILWLDRISRYVDDRPAPLPCEEPWLFYEFVDTTVYTDDGTAFPGQGDASPTPPFTPPAFATKTTLGAIGPAGRELVLPATAGELEWRAGFIIFDSPFLPPAGPLQSWVGAIQKSVPRFSLGLEATPTSNRCNGVNPVVDR